MLRFWKDNGHQGSFSLVKATLWRHCKFLLEDFKGNKAITRGHEGNSLCCLCLCEVSALLFYMYYSLNLLFRNLFSLAMEAVFVHFSFLINFEVHCPPAGGWKMFLYWKRLFLQYQFMGEKKLRVVVIKFKIFYQNNSRLPPVILTTAYP